MSMESIRIENMYDLNETIAAEIFEGKTYPVSGDWCWEQDYRCLM